VLQTIQGENAGLKVLTLEYSCSLVGSYIDLLIIWMILPIAIYKPIKIYYYVCTNICMVFSVLKLWLEVLLADIDSFFTSLLSFNMKSGVLTMIVSYFAWASFLELLLRHGLHCTFVCPYILHHVLKSRVVYYVFPFTSWEICWHDSNLSAPGEHSFYLLHLCTKIWTL